MTVDALAAERSFDQRREELRARLREAEDPSPLGLAVEAVGRVVQKLTGRPRSFSYRSSAAIVIAMLLVVYGLERSLRPVARNEQPELVALRLGSVGFVLLLFWVARRSFLDFHAAFRDYVLDHVERPEDLDVLGELLDPPRGLRWALVWVFILLYGPLLEWVNVEFLYPDRYGAHFVSLTGILFQGGFGLGLLSLLGAWLALARLGGLRLRLYTPDPSKSEVILRLWAMIRTMLLRLSVFGVSLTLLVTLLGLTDWVTLLILALTLWIPVTGFFVIGQWSLSKIISRARWRELHDVQQRVERLKTEENIEEKETMEAMRRLMEYHDCVVRAPGSVLNVRTSLSYVNSLLLPLVAFVLTNLETVRKLFS